MPLATISGYAAIMKKSLESGGEPSSDFLLWVSRISEAAEFITEVMHALTDVKQT